MHLTKLSHFNQGNKAKKASLQMPFKNPVLFIKVKYEKKNFWCGKSHFHAEPTVSICGLNLFVWFGGSCEPGDTVSLQIMMVMGMGWSHRTSQFGKVGQNFIVINFFGVFQFSLSFPSWSTQGYKG